MHKHNQPALALGITLLFVTALGAQPPAFDPFEATIPQMRAALASGSITCKQLVQFYLDRMDALDIGGPKLNAVRVRNPKALQIADAMDRLPASAPRGPLFCIPVLVKDNIDTLDMPTTAGSVALQNTFSLDDSFLVKQLKAAGAIIIAKGNLTEFANFLTNGMPTGYSSLGGYVLDAYDPRPIPTPLTNSDGRQALGPGGSSSGPGVVASANLAAATVGTETSGSILSPSNANSAVGIKPTVGLISRQGVVPIAASQDTAGPITRTVTDAAIMLGALAGVDGRDPATVSSIGMVPGDYTQFLKADALAGARLGVVRQAWNGRSAEEQAIGERAFQVMRDMGADVFDVTIDTLTQVGQLPSTVLLYEFKRDLDTYLAGRGPNSPIKTLADVIAYNSAHADVALKYGQILALQSQALDLYGDEPGYIAARSNDLMLAKVQGIDAAMDKYNLTALIFPANSGAGIAAKSGYPSVIVPAGYSSNAVPIGVTFTGKAYSEPTLISLAYAYEQASKVRQPPSAALRLLPGSAQIQPGKIVNLASGATGAIAPGEIVSIAGSGMGPAQAVVSSVTANKHVDTIAGTTRIRFDGVPAPILSAQSGQIVAIAPYSLSGKTTAQMRVEYAGQTSAPVAVQVTDVAPGIFTPVFNADGSKNSPSNPAQKGSTITFYVTGEGIVSSTNLATLPIDGRLAGVALPTTPATSTPLLVPVQPVVVGVNGAGVTILYAGSAPGLAGTMQVNAQLDANTPSGTLELVVQVGSKFSPTTTVSVQ